MPCTTWSPRSSTTRWTRRWPGTPRWIEIELHENGHVTVRDNGRGIPTDPHPKDPAKSALEIIFCTLNAGGKFSGDSYETSGGLHGVGSSVVNALSDHLRVEVARNKELYAMEFSRGLPQGPLEKIGAAPNRRGTSVTFHPDPEIFGSLKLKPARLFKMARSKAYLFSGVEIRWKSAIADGDTPTEATFHFPGGLADYLDERLGGAITMPRNPSPASSISTRSSTPPARSNGRSTGPRRATASSSPTATPSRRPRAARMRPASGPRSSRASRPMASW